MFSGGAGQEVEEGHEGAMAASAENSFSLDPSHLSALAI